MMDDLPFEFATRQVLGGPECFIAQMPEKIVGKEALLLALSECLHFPGYFGHNWDALSDCLRDFNWISAKEVILMHADVPQLPARDLSTYLGVLGDAVASWKDDQVHQLRVVFPSSARDVVAHALKE